MITTKDCLTRFGNPKAEKGMTLLELGEDIAVGRIPKKIYCNKYLTLPLTQALRNVVERGLVDQIKSWDGCFNIRMKKTGQSLSLHSWGLAIDINAAWNAYGAKPTMSAELVKCFTDAGFTWGGNWAKPDGMHFELASFS